MSQNEYKEIRNGDWESVRYSVRRFNERLADLEGHGGTSKKLSSTDMSGNQLVSGPVNQKKADESEFITKGYLRSKEAADLINGNLRDGGISPLLITPTSGTPGPSGPVGPPGPAPIPVTIKTANYGPSVGEFVPCDISGGSFTITLPTSPANASFVEIFLSDISTDKILSIVASGTDVFNRPSGPQTAYMVLKNESAIFTYQSSTGIWFISDTAAISNFAIGFSGIDSITPLPSTAISIDTSTRILTITPPLGYFNFFVGNNGKVTKFRKTGTVNFPAFTDTDGLWHFYFDNTGTAITTQTPWKPSDFPFIALVYRIIWNSTLSGANKLVRRIIETHENDIPADAHQWMHLYGAVWNDGLDIFSNALVSPSSPNADGRNAVIALSEGTCVDDNLDYTIHHSTTPTLDFYQDLGLTTPASLNATNSALFQVRYRDSSNRVFFLPATRFPFDWDSGTNLPNYITTVGVRTPVGNGNNFVYFVYCTQDPKAGSVVSIVSAPTDYTNLTDARAVTWTDIQSSYVYLRDQEIRPLYKLIFEYKSSFDIGTKKSILRETADLRKALVTSTTTISGSLPASSVTVVPFDAISSTNVQNALAEINTKIATTVSGTIGKIAKFTGTNTIGDSLISEASGLIGVNVAALAPTTELDVQGIITTRSAAANDAANPLESIRMALTGFVPTTSYRNSIWNSVNAASTEGSMQFRLANSVGGQLTVMTLRNSGFVGIGTTVPNAPLEVLGSSTTHFSALKLRNNDNSATLGADVGIDFEDVNSDIVTGSLRNYYETGGYGLDFHVWSTNLNHVARLDRLGNFGIGRLPRTSTRLDVDGGDIAIAAGGGTGNWQLNSLTMGRYAAGTYGWIQAGGAAAGDFLALNPVGGYVGIGTTVPNAVLSLGSRTPGTPLIDLYDGGAATKFGIGLNSGEVQFYGYTGGHWSFNTGGDLQASGTNEVMRVGTDGKVGIGTIAPATGLHVKGAYPLGYATIERTGVNGAGAAAVMDIRTDSKTIGDTIISSFAALNSASNPRNYAAISAQIADPTAGAEYGNLRFFTTNNAVLTDRLTILSNGNVGLSQGTPTERLEVDGNVKLKGSVAVDTNIALWSSTSYFYNLKATGDDFQILEAGSTVRFHIDYPTGNVGIGTTTPGVNLHVSGAGATVSSKLSGLGDYQDFIIGKDDVVSSVRYWGFGVRNDTYFGNSVHSYQIVGEHRDAGGTVDYYIVPAIFNPNGDVILTGAANATNGRVGIGTTAPVARVDILAPVTSLANVKGDLSTSGLNFQGVYDNANYSPGITWSYTNLSTVLPLAGIFSFATSSGTFLYLGTSSNYGLGITNQAITIDPTGQVGIGTTIPTSPLSIQGESSTDAVPPPVSLGIRSGYSTGTSRHGLGFYVNSSTFIGSGIFAPPGELAFYTSLNWNAANPTEKMRINYIGNVGIGNVDPVARLSVTGASSVYDNTGIFQITTGTGVAGDNKLTFGVVDGDYSWIQATQPGTNYRNLSLQPAGGYLGVGVTAPTAKLDLDGVFKQGRDYTRILELPQPGAAAGPGKWFIRLQPSNVGNLASVKVSVRGTYNYGPVMGWLEAEFSYYAPGDNTIDSSLRDFRVTATTGPAFDNLRIGDMVVEGGYISIPIWCADTNAIDAKIEYWDAVIHANLTNSAWISEAMPAKNFQSIRSDLYVQGKLGVGSNALGEPLGVLGVANSALAGFYAPLASTDYAVTRMGKDAAHSLRSTYYYNSTTASQIIALGFSGGADFIVALGSGNVGINTATPGYGLEVKSDVSHFYPINDAFTNAAAQQIIIGESTANANYRLALGYFYDAGSGWGGSIQSIAGGAGAPLRINADGGNVGIGTIGPLGKVHIEGTLATTTPEHLLVLKRDYNSGVAYEAAASFRLFNLSSGVINTRLDMMLLWANTSGSLPDTNVLTLLSNNCVVADTNGKIGFRYSPADNNLYSYITGGGAQVMTIQGGMFTATATQEAVRISGYSGYVSFQNNGWMGLGTTGPLSTLHIKVADASIQLGDDVGATTNNKVALRILTSDSNGNIYIDSKTFGGGSLVWRIGEGAAWAFTTTWMEVDATAGAIKLPSLAGSGTRNVVVDASGNLSAP